ncbi:MAG: hypothetical protein ACAI35_23645, partial [Candidatus Methylacidiphilales bacterium]
MDNPKHVMHPRHAALRALLPLPMMAVVAVALTLSGCGPGGRGPSSQATGTGIGTGVAPSGPGGPGGSRASQHLVYDPETGTLKPVDRPSAGTSYADNSYPSPAPGSLPGAQAMGRPQPGKPAPIKGVTPAPEAVPGKVAKVVPPPVAPEYPTAPAVPASRPVPTAPAVPNSRTRVANSKVPPLPVTLANPPSSSRPVKPVKVKQPDAVVYQPLEEKPLVDPTPPPPSTSYPDLVPPPVPTSTPPSGSIASSRLNPTSKTLRPATSTRPSSQWHTDVRPKPAPQLPPVRPQDIKPSPTYYSSRAPGAGNRVSDVSAPVRHRPKPTSPTGIARVSTPGESSTESGASSTGNKTRPVVRHGNKERWSRNNKSAKPGQGVEPTRPQVRPSPVKPQDKPPVN